MLRELKLMIVRLYSLVKCKCIREMGRREDGIGAPCTYVL